MPMGLLCTCTVLTGFNELLGPGKLFVKCAYSLNPEFLFSDKISEVKNLFSKPGHSLTPNSLILASTV